MTIVDTRGLMCPLPLLRLKQALLTVESEGLLELLATDPAARLDVGVYLDQMGHRLVDCEERNDGVLRFLIQKCGPGGRN
jgi:tRNA 2-thiouridine synthesizing protein A